MRFSLVDDNGVLKLAVERDGELYATATPAAADELDRLIREGAAALEQAATQAAEGSRLDGGKVRFLPPLSRPGKIICVGLNYVDHSTETGFVQPDYPTLFMRVATSLVGHGEPIIRPTNSDALDYEGELAAVIGKSGRHIAKEHALDHIIAYAPFNDGSVRDYQFRTPQWTVGKNFDGTGAFGPSLVTADELPPGGSGLKIETRLNGQVMQSASTSEVVFDVATLVEILSEVMTLEVGDVIVTGTPSGIGHAREPRVYMKPGDVVEVEIEKVGLLRNTVADEAGRA